MSVSFLLLIQVSKESQCIKSEKPYKVREVYSFWVTITYPFRGHCNLGYPYLAFALGIRDG